MSGSEIAGLIVLCIIFVGMIMGCVLAGYKEGRHDEEHKWKKELVERELAQYNSQTGKWEWIEK